MQYFVSVANSAPPLCRGGARLPISVGQFQQSIYPLFDSSLSLGVGTRVSFLVAIGAEQIALRQFRPQFLDRRNQATANDEILLLFRPVVPVPFEARSATAFTLAPSGLDLGPNNCLAPAAEADPGSPLVITLLLRPVRHQISSFSSSAGSEIKESQTSA